MVASRESADHSNIVEPSFYNDNQITDPENDLRGSRNATANKKAGCKPYKNKEAIEQRLLTSTKSFINNYPTVKLVSYMAEKKKWKVEKTWNGNDEIDVWHLFKTFVFLNDLNYSKLKYLKSLSLFKLFKNLSLIFHPVEGLLDNSE